MCICRRGKGKESVSYLALCVMEPAISLYSHIHIQAATANENNRLQEAHKHHKRAQFCNVGGAAVLTLSSALFIILVIVGTLVSVDYVSSE